LSTIRFAASPFFRNWTEELKRLVPTR
jgi:hypothetical protein